MSDLFWLTDEQMARLQPYFPRATRGLGLSGAVSLGSVLPDTASGMMSGPRRTRSSGKETTIGAQRNENGEKWCPFGNGHGADPTRLFANRTKLDGLNDICSYQQGKVDQRKKG